MHPDRCAPSVQYSVCAGPSDSPNPPSLSFSNASRRMHRHTHRNTQERRCRPHARRSVVGGLAAIGLAGNGGDPDRPAVLRPVLGVRVCAALPAVLPHPGEQRLDGEPVRYRQVQIFPRKFRAPGHELICEGRGATIKNPVRSRRHQRRLPRSQLRCNPIPRTRRGAGQSMDSSAAGPAKTVKTPVHHHKFTMVVGCRPTASAPNV